MTNAVDSGIRHKLSSNVKVSKYASKGRELAKYCLEHIFVLGFHTAAVCNAQG